MNKKPTDAMTDVRLQELWEKCKEPGTEPKKLMLDILIDDVINTFGRMFIPYRFMQTSAKCGHVISRQDITVLYPHKNLFQSEEPTVEGAIEEASQSLLEGFLVRAEQVVKEHLKMHKGVPSPAEFNKAMREDVWTKEMPATHAWVGREAAGALMRSEEWEQFVTVAAPGGMAEAATEDEVRNAVFGSFLRAFDVEVYSDLLRYDTLQTLDNDEWGVFSNKHPHKVWVEWPTESFHDFKTRKTTVNCTLRIGTEAKDAP